MPACRFYYFLWLLLLTLMAASAKSQLCTGSLGDPVVNISFGTGDNPGPVLASAHTTYSYTTDLCPPDGSYTIVNSTSNCFGNTWHTVTEDHTPGDQNGYMMLVNGSVTPDFFYLDTIRNLCSGTTYEFSAWIMNILRAAACGGAGNLPKITFSIETTSGIVITSYSTGDIAAAAAPVWNQYGFYFALPAGVSDLVLRMTNNAPGGCGNDLALDDITLRPCGPLLGVNSLNGNGNNHYCPGRNFTINGNVQGGFANPDFQWQQSFDNGTSWIDLPGANTINYAGNLTNAGSYLFRMTVAAAGNIAIARCRIASKGADIIIDSLVYSVSNSSPACEGDNIDFAASGGVQYAWSGPGNFNSSVSAPSINAAAVLNTGTYHVQITTANGCLLTDSTIVTIHTKPVADAGPDKTIFEGASAGLSGHASGDYSGYKWSPEQYINNPALLSPTVSPPADITYILTVLSTAGCGNASDSVKVHVLKEIRVPNVFSPNGDGQFDTWAIPSLEEYPGCKVRVYNRYGQVVFQSTGYVAPGWDGTYDGKPLPIGVYYWIIDPKNGRKQINGSLTILR